MMSTDKATPNDDYDARQEQNPELTGDAQRDGLPATAGYGGALAHDAQDDEDESAGDADHGERPASNRDERVENVRDADDPAASHLIAAGEDQDRGIMDQNVTSHEERVEGIVQQARMDVPSGEVEDVVFYLERRFRDAEIQIEDDELRGIAEHIASGSGGPWYRGQS